MCLTLCRYQTLTKIPLLQGRGEKCSCCKTNLVTLGIFSCIEAFDCSIFSWWGHGNAPQAVCTIWRAAFHSCLQMVLWGVSNGKGCCGWAAGGNALTLGLRPRVTITALTSTAGQVMKTRFLTFYNLCHLEHRVFNLSVGWVIFLLAKWVVLSKGWEMLLSADWKKMQKALFVHPYCLL